MTTELSEGGDVTLPKEVSEPIEALECAARLHSNYHPLVVEARAALERAILAYGQRVTPEGVSLASVLTAVDCIAKAEWDGSHFFLTVYVGDDADEKEFMGTPRETLFAAMRMFDDAEARAALSASPAPKEQS